MPLRDYSTLDATTALVGDDDEEAKARLAAGMPNGYAAPMPKPAPVSMESGELHLPPAGDLDRTKLLRTGPASDLVGGAVVPHGMAPQPGVDYDPKGSGDTTWVDTLKALPGSDMGKLSDDWANPQSRLHRYLKAAFLGDSSILDKGLPGSPTPGVAPAAPAAPAAPPAAPTPDLNAEKNKRDAAEQQMMDQLHQPPPDPTVHSKGTEALVKAVASAPPVTPPPPKDGITPYLREHAYHYAPLPDRDTGYSLADIAGRNRAADITNREYLANLTDIRQGEDAREAGEGSPIEREIRAQKQNQEFEEGQPWQSNSMLRYDSGDGLGMRDAPQTKTNETIRHAQEMQDKIDLIRAQSQGKTPYEGFKNLGEMKDYYVHQEQRDTLLREYQRAVAAGVPPEKAKRAKEDMELELAIGNANREGNYSGAAALLQAKNNPNAMMMVPTPPQK